MVCGGGVGGGFTAFFFGAFLPIMHTIAAIAARAARQRPRPTNSNQYAQDGHHSDLSCVVVVAVAPTVTAGEPAGTPTGGFGDTVAVSASRLFDNKRLPVDWPIFVIVKE